MRRSINLAVAAVVLFAAAGNAQINTTEGGVDQWSSYQSWLSINRGLYWGTFVIAGASVGQVFRTPAASAFLEDFSFFLGSSFGGATFRAILAPWTGTAPGAAVWTSPVLGPATPNVATGPLAGFQEVTFTPNVDLSPQQLFVAYVEIRSISGYTFPRTGWQRLAFRESVLNDGMGRVVIPLSGEASFLDNEDAAFTANFYSAAPEPSTIVLLASGLLGVGAMALRRRRL